MTTARLITTTVLAKGKADELVVHCCRRVAACPSLSSNDKRAVRVSRLHTRPLVGRHVATFPVGASRRNHPNHKWLPPQRIRWLTWPPSAPPVVRENLIYRHCPKHFRSSCLPTTHSRAPSLSSAIGLGVCGSPWQNFPQELQFGGPAHVLQAPAAGCPQALEKEQVYTIYAQRRSWHGFGAC